MALQLPPSEQLTYATVRIECDTPRGTSTGTGFLYQFAVSKDRHVPAIVTNKHVIEGASRGRIVFHTQDAQNNVLRGQHFTYTIDQFANNWIPHPDAAVDLCVFPMAPLHRDAEARGKRLFYVSLSSDSTATPALFEQLTPLEDVVMVGYPSGIWDSANNMPVFRRGITATSPTLDYEGRSEFVIDAACFPGSSGSPVFLYNTGSYATRDGGLTIGTRIVLLGILYAGPQFTAEGEVKVITVPTQQKVVSRALIPINLGMVIKATRLSDFEKIFLAAK